MDPPEHTRYRRMMSPEFVIQRIEGMRPQVQESLECLAQYGAWVWGPATEGWRAITGPLLGGNCATSG